MKRHFLKYLSISIICSFVSLISFGQQTSNHLNNWYFGDGVGISFNSGTATNTTSAIKSYEVSTSYSDGSGNVLFYGGAWGSTSYGDGRVIWDASHDTMPNSNIHVDHSSSCGLTSVPVPGNCDRYYLFYLVGSTPVSAGMGNSLHYSVVDMTLPGNGTIPVPLGDIDPAQKDVLLYGPDTLAEKVKVIQKGNTENYWVIVRSLNRDLFYSFEVTSAGINPVPVVSTISATTWSSAIGSPAFSWLAVNRERNRVAEANGFGPEVKLYDFDNLTGILSLAEVVIPTGTFGSDIPYGIEFSPSGDVLYVSWYEGGANTYLSSFDITVGSPGIAATRQDYLIANGPAEYGALVKAPDGKIYGTRTSTTQLTVINTPENYLAPSISAPGFNPAPGSPDIGMPNFTYYYHPDNFIDTLAGNDRSVCKSLQAEIGAIGYDSIWANYSWSPASMLAGSANEATPITVNLTSDQQYILHVINACGDTIKSDTTIVAVSTLDAEITTNSPICDGESLALNGSPSGLGAGSYTWVRPNGNPIGGAGLENVFITPFPNPIPGGWWYLTVDDGTCTDTDSTFVVTHPIYNIKDTTTICSGSNFTYADGTVSTNILVDESHISTDTTIFGCDSIIREFLVVDPCSNLSVNSNSVICMGDSVLLLANGSQTGYSWADSLSIGIVLQNPDSFYIVSPIITTTYAVYNTTDTVYTTVIVNNSTSVTNILNECDGFGITVGTNTYSTTGIYNDTLVGGNLYGCDSIITTDLTIISSPTSLSVLNECDGFSILINGNNYNSTGVYNDTIINGSFNGCDSIVITDLTIFPLVVSNSNLSICQGDSILLGGIFQNSSGTYNDTIANGAINGCDSVIQTSLTVNPISFSITNASVCQGDSILINGVFQSAAGTYSDTIPNSNVNGCDSILQIILNINQPVVNTVNTNICQGDSVLLGGSFQQTTGTYYDSIPNGAANGCDSIIETILTVNPIADATITPQAALCTGDSPFNLTSVQSGGLWGGQGVTDVNLGEFSPSVAGVGSHQIVYTISGNCGNSDTINIVVNASPIFDISTIDDNCDQSLGEIILTNLSGIPPYLYSWVDLSINGNAASNLQEGTYTVFVSDSTGCSNSYITTIYDLELDCDYHVYLPNVFSPNGDGENDILYVLGKGIESISLSIYNRWGNKVFETNDMLQGWDGTYNGNEQGNAVFVYYITATFVNGKTVEEKGNVSIVK